MGGIILAWAFASFLYFKITFDAVFSRDISIIASLLMAVIFGITVFIASGIYAAKLFRYNAIPGRVSAKLSELLLKTVWPFLGLCVGFTVLTRLIVFGFSKDLTRQIRMFDYRGNVEEDFVQFVLIVIAPLLLHYAMCIYPTYFNATRKNQDQI
jgi:hypothetical protein